MNKDIEPWHLEVINESPNHNVPDGAESHFKIIIVSEKFFEIRAVKRHQLIYSVLNEEMQKIHAIAIHPFTPEEWKEKTILNTSERQFQQELECSFLGSGNTLISTEKLLALPYKQPVYTH